MPHAHAPEILPFGLDGLLLRFSRAAADPASGAVQAAYGALAAAPPHGAVEIAPSLGSVLVRFDPEVTTRAALTAALAAVLDKRDWAGAEAPPPKRRWEVPACFCPACAPGLAEAAARAGAAPDAAVRDLTGADLRVLAIGFAPGFPYLGQLPARWNIPRMAELTAQVPAGAIGLALRQLVLFPAPSPTGWRQVGRAAFLPFQPQAPMPFPLAPGDALRFAPAPHDELEALRTAGDPMGGARLRGPA